MLGICSWTNEIVSDVGMGELSRTFNHVLKKKIHGQGGDRLTVNQGSKLSLFFWQAVSRESFALFFPFTLVRVVVISISAAISIAHVLFEAIERVLKRKSRYFLSS